MKRYLAVLLLASCTQAPQSWKDKPNPLEVPKAIIVEPEANGYWGPFGVAPLEHRNFTGSP